MTILSDKTHPPRRSLHFARGIRIGFPIFLGYMPVGIAFGILASNLGFSAVQSLTCSATALAGAGQFIALSVMRAGESAAAVIAATTVVNLRYVLFAATMSPYLKGMTSGQQAGLAFTLTDETFAINIADRRSGHATGWSQLGVGAIAWIGWVAGTGVGALASTAIGDPSVFGVDFAMPAMFVALLFALAENRRHVVTALIAGGIALSLPALSSVGIHIANAWFIVIASIGAASTATLVFRDDGAQHGQVDRP
ncbi:MAG: AzlC family ABC transporter permease [Coriobacteriia bacterium]